MSGTVTEVWVAAGGGHDMVRADAIVMLRLDETGRLTAQLRDDAQVRAGRLLERTTHYVARTAQGTSPALRVGIIDVGVGRAAREPLLLAEEMKAPEFNRFTVEMCRAADESDHVRAVVTCARNMSDRLGWPPQPRRPAENPWTPSTGPVCRGRGRSRVE